MYHISHMLTVKHTKKPYISNINLAILFQKSTGNAVGRKYWVENQNLTKIGGENGLEERKICEFV